MIRLLYITNGVSGPNGLERVLSVKASYLADKLNYEVHILTLNEMDKNPFYTFSNQIKFHNVIALGNSVKYSLQYYTGLNALVKTINPDIISVCDDGLKGFFLPLLLRRPCPMIYERHASIKLNFDKNKANILHKIKNSIIHRLMNFGGKMFDSFVVLTKGNLKEWNTYNEKVIPNPVSFVTENISALTNKKVIAVGSHSYNKGYDLLLKAWKQVLDTGADWKLDIYGKSDNNRTYIKMADDLKLSDSVAFHEPVQNISEKYLESSIMVLPSRSEGFGMVLIEAMACGVPCVSFDCPHGPADIITNGEDGFLVEKSDTRKLALKLLQLMENDEQRKQMGKKAKQNVEKYLPESTVAIWDELFHSLLKQKHV